MTWDEALAALRPRPAGRGLAERTRAAPTASTSASSWSGRSERARARRRPPPRRASLRRGALRGGRGAGDGRPQARGDPRPLRLPGPHRAGRPEPRRPRLQPEAGAEAAAGAHRRAGALPARADPGPHAAGAARPGDARARLLLRAALRGDRQPRRSAPSTPETEQLRVLGKGSKERLLPVGEPAQQSVARYEERARHALAGDPREQALFLSKNGRRLSNSDVTRRLGLWVREAALAAGVSRTPCATASPPTCWRAAPTCARSRSCSATPRYRPLRSTRGSTPHACGTPMPPPIRVRERDYTRNRPCNRRIDAKPWKRA